LVPYVPFENFDEPVPEAEAPSEDILLDTESMTWKVYEGKRFVVHAAPLKHRNVRCIGYVVRERNTKSAKGRKVATCCQPPVASFQFLGRTWSRLNLT